MHEIIYSLLVYKIFWKFWVVNHTESYERSAIRADKYKVFCLSCLFSIGTAYFPAKWGRLKVVGWRSDLGKAKLSKREK